MKTLFVFCVLLFTSCGTCEHLFSAELLPATQGLLYPRDTETREVRSLDGVWNFIPSDSAAKDQHWYRRDFSTDPDLKPIQMPVPASYNDITVDASLRDHVGDVWYDRNFFVPKSWGADRRVWIRFGSVHYSALVWVNGEAVAKHEIGHLPFKAEITDVLNFGQENRVTVLCNNVLTLTTIPQGTLQEVETDNGTETIQLYTFDFFNYAGIQRSVHLYTTPIFYISDVILATDLEGTTGKLSYEIKTSAQTNDECSILLKILDKSGNLVAESWEKRGVISIENVNAWWPIFMSDNPGYLYTIKV